MTRQRTLSALSILFSLLTIVVIVLTWTLGTPSKNSGWAELSLAFMFLTGGINRYLDKQKYGVIAIATALFLIAVFIIITAMR